MGKGYLIDSNIVIAYLDSKLPDRAMEFMNDIVDKIPVISVITQIEVLRFNTSEQVYAILEDFIHQSNIIKLDDPLVEQTIAVCKAYRIKLPDAIIAATAMLYDLILLTRNVDDFKKISGLNLMDPWQMKSR